MSFISSKDNKEMLDQLMSFAEPMEPESTFAEMYKASTRLFINENLSYSAFLNDQNYEDRNQKVRDLVENNTIDNVGGSTDSNDDVIYKTSSTEGHVMQVNSSGVPFFGHIDCGTY